ncbi:MAG: hypothetical protein IPO25_23055 [Saprospiraceae bacterium]|nr:hypothetical protein [Saprospiraceae bacterium]
MYKLNDFFSLFYFKFMARGNKGKENEWSKPVYRFILAKLARSAFERLCFAHIPQIKNALGLSGHPISHFMLAEPVHDEGAKSTVIIDLSDGVDQCT